jgi:DNA-binding GntR family transcriptional regulator
MEIHRILHSLREKIVWLELAPESVLNVSELAKLYGVSRTPIKEILIYLEAEGWVLRNGSYFMVTPLSIDRIKEITEIRSVLEVQAYVWAMHRISKEEMDILNEIRQEIKKIEDSLSNRKMVELDLKFHRTLFKATKNNQLALHLERLLSHYLRFWLSIPLKDETKPFFAWTLEIIQAIESKQEDMLKSATLGHLKRSVDKIMGTF